MNYLKIMRPKSWIKNLLIFAPILFANAFNYTSVFNTVLGFICFSLVASSIYIINDIFDIEIDRTNPHKNKRPIPAGLISIKQANIVSIICYIIGIAVSFLFLNINFTCVLIIYFFINRLYVSHLKHVIIVDVLILAIGFVLRIIAGGYLADVMVTKWIIVTSFFLAIFLGFAKRRGEVAITNANITKRKVAMEYTLEVLDKFIMASGIMAIISYALFTLDNGVIEKFSSPHLFYTILIPVYAIFKYIILIPNAEDTDPTNILFTDKTIMLSVVVWLILTCSIMYFHL